MRDTPNPLPAQLLTPLEVSDLLRLSPDALEARRRRGQIPCVHLGRLVRFRADDIHRIANEGIPLTPPPPRRIARVK